MEKEVSPVTAKLLIPELKSGVKGSANGSLLTGYILLRAELFARHS
jgi:hypothetical protein